MARYRKIDPRFWKDEKIRLLNVEEKLVALYCMTAQSNRIGLFSFSPAMAAEDMGMLPQTFAKRFEKVVLTLNWTFDEGQKVLLCPTWWKYNQPENENVLKGNLKDILDLPKTSLISIFVSNLSYLEERFHKTFKECLANVPETLPQTFANTEAVTEAVLYSTVHVQSHSSDEHKEGKKNNAAAWPDDAQWLHDFLTTQHHITPPNGTLLDYSWWESVSVTAGGLNIRTLETEFARMAAWIMENRSSTPASPTGWKRFVRRWLERTYERERKVKYAAQTKRYGNSHSGH